MTIDTIYATTPSPDWADVAVRLSDDRNFEPRYWVCHGDLKDLAQDRFPDAIIHDSIDAIQGRFPIVHNVTDRVSYPLDSMVLTDFSEYESIALKMMDRLDIGNVSGANFTYSERIRHYHRILSFCINLITEVDPDVAVFGATPHLVFDYLLYAVCENRDVDTIILTHTTLPQFFCVRKSINDTLLSEYNSISEGPSPEFGNHLNNIRGNYTNARPEYMKKDRNFPRLNTIKSAKKVISSIPKIPRLLEIQPKAYVKRKGTPIESSRMKLWEWKLLRLKARMYRRKLKQNYSQVATDPDLSVDYIYYPLHYQPERTTSPEGFHYAHQHLAIELLAKSAPEGVVVYVKEHPSQFGSRLKGEQGRHSQYYDDISQLMNVELVSMKTGPFELIDNSLAVATVTGTAGWEALVRGVPSIVFGNAWYRECPGCFHVTSFHEVQEAINQISQIENIPSHQVDHFVTQLESVGYRGSLNETSNENINSLYQAVCEHYTQTSA